MGKTLALFDFDHTLYSKDSLLEVTKHIVGRQNFLTGIAVLSPFLIMMKLGMLNNASTKQRYLAYFFKNMDYTYFKKASQDFALTKIEKDLDSKLKAALMSHINSGDDVYIVTASFADWIAPWCQKMNINIIASIPEITNGKVNGKISGLNCYGNEKVARIKKVIDLNSYESIIVYGKGKGDREMLTLARDTNRSR